MATRDEKIQALAHRIWEENGRPEGKDGEHWEQAAKIVDEENSVAAQAPKDPTMASRNRS